MLPPALCAAPQDQPIELEILVLPNPLLVEIADDMLGRSGRMIEAVEEIGYGEPAMEGWPFSIPSHWPAER